MPQAETIAREHPRAAPQASPLQSVIALRAALARKPGDPATRLALIDALVALAGAAGPRVNDAVAAIDEAQALLPEIAAGDASSLDEEWRVRTFGVHRVRAALAQGRNAHEEAVAAFDAALAVLPSDIDSAGRDANAARLQLLVRLARSRLALAQGAQVVAEMRLANDLMQALHDDIPARALEMMGASVMGHHAIALAATGDIAGAEDGVTAFFAGLDRINAAELEPLRQQIARAWAGVLAANGRGAEASAVLASAADAAQRAHDASCGCGHDHGAHGHAHAHHQHAHHHHGSAEHDACGCGHAH